MRKRGFDMKTATYEIKTESGHNQRWTFEELHSDDDYGNGNYISVIRNDNECIAYVDMRYCKYVFESFCISYIKQYFGDNLLSFERV
jgi:hypothetical protein